MFSLAIWWLYTDLFPNVGPTLDLGCDTNNKQTLNKQILNEYVHKHKRIKHIIICIRLFI